MVSGIPMYNLRPSLTITDEVDTKNGSISGGAENSSQQQQSSSFEAILHQSTDVDKHQLRQLSWKNGGIPEKHRGTSWKLLCNYLPTNIHKRSSTLKRKRGEYHEFVTSCYDATTSRNSGNNTNERNKAMAAAAAAGEILRQIQLDVPRTAPDVAFFQNERIRRCLERVLFAFAMRYPSTCYVQGMNDLLTPFLVVFLADACFDGDVHCLLSVDDNVSYSESTKRKIMDMKMSSVSETDLSNVEADCYGCFAHVLMQMEDHYTCDQPGLTRMVKQLEYCVREMDPVLHRHVVSTHGIPFIHFAYRWMNCLLLREWQFRHVLRLWDTYLSEEGGGSQPRTTSSSSSPSANDGDNKEGKMKKRSAFDEFHVYVCASMLQKFGNEIKSMDDFDDLFYYLQNLPTHRWTERDVESVLNEAYVHRTFLKDLASVADENGGGDLDFELDGASPSSSSSSGSNNPVLSSLSLTMSSIQINEAMEQARVHVASVGESIVQAVSMIKSDAIAATTPIDVVVPTKIAARTSATHVETSSVMTMRTSSTASSSSTESGGSSSTSTSVQFFRFDQHDEFTDMAVPTANMMYDADFLCI